MPLFSSKNKARLRSALSGTFWHLHSNPRAAPLSSEGCPSVFFFSWTCRPSSAVPTARPHAGPVLLAWPKDRRGCLVGRHWWCFNKPSCKNASFALWLNSGNGWEKQVAGGPTCLLCAFWISRNSNPGRRLWNAPQKHACYPLFLEQLEFSFCLLILESWQENIIAFKPKSLRGTRWARVDQNCGKTSSSWEQNAYAPPRASFWGETISQRLNSHQEKENTLPPPCKLGVGFSSRAHAQLLRHRAYSAPASTDCNFCTAHGLQPGRKWKARLTVEGLFSFQLDTPQSPTTVTF